VILANIGNQWSDLLNDMQHPGVAKLRSFGDHLALLLLATTENTLLAAKLPVYVKNDSPAVAAAK
jgi:hypothetical protein